MPKELHSILVAPETSILDAVKAIESGALQIALVVDGGRRLVGTVTDGDVRRGLLRGVGMEQPVSQVMNAKPHTVPDRTSRDDVLALMRQLSINQVPVVDAAGRVLRLEWLGRLIQTPSEETWVVLMAGGLGARLRPLTEAVPKPLLPVGGRPLLETTVRNLASQGYRRIFLSVNYMAQQFRDHFGDGSAFGAEIVYLDETKPLGTAGSLSLLPERPKGPMIVMNGDLLTSVNFGQLVSFHREQAAIASMCVREYSFQVPYGVVRTEGTRLLGITEKPHQTYFVNAGIYVVSPEALDLIPADARFDMSQLFDRVIAAGFEAAAFPLREYWVDIGRFDDLERARTQFDEEFG